MSDGLPTDVFSAQHWYQTRIDPLNLVYPHDNKNCHLDPD
jgi:hypothetical protein